MPASNHAKAKTKYKHTTSSTRVEQIKSLSPHAREALTSSRVWGLGFRVCRVYTGFATCVLDELHLWIRQHASNHAHPKTKYTAQLPAHPCDKSNPQRRSQAAGGKASWPGSTAFANITRGDSQNWACLSETHLNQTPKLNARRAAKSCCKAKQTLPHAQLPTAHPEWHSPWKALPLVPPNRSNP